MADVTKEMHDFKKQVEALRKFQGRGTELISVYITPGYAVPDVVAKLRDEYGQAANIKSASTRKNVQSALEKIMHFLKGVQKPPENGIAVFAGNVSENEGKTDYQIFSVVPPVPVPVQFYRCESKFVLEPLEELLDRGETYGLVVMDGKEATVAVLKGKVTKVVKKLESTAHQKVQKGGQCVHEDSIILTSQGAKKTSEVNKGDLLLSFDFTNFKTVYSPCAEVMKRKATDELVIETDYPKKYLKLTGEHVVFVLTPVGIMEKHASELKKGDVLLSSCKAPALELTRQAISMELTGQVMGYFLGDGTVDGNRFVFYDADEQVVNYYSELASNLFNCNSSTRKRVRGFSLKSKSPKGCFEAKIYSKNAVDNWTTNHPELIKKKIPSSMPISLAKGFLKGLFDAEGSVSLSSNRICLAMTDEDVVQKTASLLSLFGISTSVFEKKARFKPQYGIEISDEESLKNFALHIGFNSRAKSRNLASLIASRKASGRNWRVPVDGRIVRKMADELGMSINHWFPTSRMFLLGKRFMSRGQFSISILPAFSQRMHELIGSSLYEVAKSYVEFLTSIAESDAAITIVKSVSKQSSSSEFYYDFDVPATRCFVANGLIVHNSAARYDRLHIEGVEYYYKRIGEAMDAFVGIKNFGGVIVGGPGPAKQDFTKGSYWNYQLKIIGVVDTGYTDEYGIREVIEKSSEILSEQEIIKEKKLLERFMKEISTNGLVAYGYQDVKNAILSKQADTLLITEELDLALNTYTCSACGKTLEKLEEDSHEFDCDCGGKYIVSSSVKIYDELVALAEENAIAIVLISQDSAEGSEFYGTFKGLGAFLRYRQQN